MTATDPASVPADPNDFPCAPGAFPYKGDVYHADRKRVSHSVLKAFRRHPWTYRRWLNGEDVSNAKTRALSVGDAFHLFLSDQGEFAARVCIKPKIDRRTNAGKLEGAAWDARCAEQNLIGLSEDEAAEVTRMAGAVDRNPLAASLLAACEPEIGVQWQDPASGLWCRVLGDWVNTADRVCVDVKSIDADDLDHVSRQAYDFGYFHQQAFYRDGFSTVYGDGWRMFWLFVTKGDCAEAIVAECPPAQLYEYHVANRQTLADLKLYRDRNCPLTGVYTSQVVALTPPRWAKARPDAPALVDPPTMTLRTG